MSNKKEEKSHKKEDAANNILNIEHEAQLPKGQLISYDKDDLEVPEKNRKELFEKIQSFLNKRPTHSSLCVGLQ